MEKKKKKSEKETDLKAEYKLLFALENKVPTGWQCPICYAVYAPTEKKCHETHERSPKDESEAATYHWQSIDGLGNEVATTGRMKEHVKKMAI